MSEIVKDPVYGYVGELHTLDVEKDNVLIFQLPRRTDMLSEVYLAGCIDALKKMNPDIRNIIVVGADVDVYELCGKEAVLLKLKGII